MSIDNFISYLQQLLSMISSQDKYSVALGKSALSTTVALAEASGKIDSYTRRVMYSAEEQFEYLVENSKDYVGKPGDYDGNAVKRRRLLMNLVPSC